MTSRRMENMKQIIYTTHWTFTSLGTLEISALFYKVIFISCPWERASCLGITRDFTSKALDYLKTMKGSANEQEHI